MRSTCSPVSFASIARNVKLSSTTVMKYIGYLRTKEGKEIDFCLTRDEEIESIIEVKLSDSNLSKNLDYFCKKYSLKGFQLVKNISRERSFDKIDILSAGAFPEKLYL